MNYTFSMSNGELLINNQTGINQKEVVMKKVIREEYAKNGCYPMVNRVASCFIGRDGIYGIVPDSADILEIIRDKDGVKELLLNGKVFTPPQGIMVIIDQCYSNYPVLLFEDGTRLQTPQSSSIYLDGKSGGVDYSTWMQLLKGEISLNSYRLSYNS